MQNGLIKLIPADDANGSVSFRDRTRIRLDAGGQGVLTETVLRLLQDSHDEELACVQRYKRHHYAYMLLATGMQARTVAAECLQHVVDEQSHADQLAERIRQLGGDPNQFSMLPRAVDDQDSAMAGDHVAMIRADLARERGAIEAYTSIVLWLGDADPWTRLTLERILVSERQHADDLVGLLLLQGRALFTGDPRTTENS
jgi:bacterioferritin